VNVSRLALAKPLTASGTRVRQRIKSKRRPIGRLFLCLKMAETLFVALCLKGDVSSVDFDRELDPFTSEPIFQIVGF
jgi:hypothetical protein